MFSQDDHIIFQQGPGCQRQFDGIIQHGSVSGRHLCFAIVLDELFYPSCVGGQFAETRSVVTNSVMTAVGT